MTGNSLFARAFCSVALSFCVAGALSAAPEDAASAGKTPAVLYVPGSYQDWKPAVAPQLSPVPGSKTKFEGYVNFSGTGEQSFKFTDAPDWTHTNYGSGPGGTLSTDGKAAGMTVSSPGYYEVTADLEKNKWTATKTTWSVIGSATPDGWDKDTPMTYDPDKQVWTVTLPLKTEGSFKFRANNAWKIDFGVNSEGKMEYVDNPFLTYNNVPDMTVPDDGTYTLTLDLHVSGKYSFNMQLKK